MTELIVEYLIVTKTPICDNIDSFKNILKVNSKLSVEARKIKTEQIEVDYKLKADKNEEHNLFYLTLIYKKENFEHNLDSFIQLIKHIRAAVHLLRVEIYTLWDDVSFYYSQKSYPLIHEVENLMRKLIIKFMVNNVGVLWTKQSLPDELKKEISTSQKKRGNTNNDKESEDKIDSENILYQLDFIHLANLLLLPYQTEDVDRLYKQLDKAKDLKDLSLEELKNFIPKSNWQRYFSDLIQYEDGEFKKQWSNLYLLRCKIAHNTIVIKKDYEDIIRLSSELREKLKNAIDKLDKIELSEREKGVIRENVDSKIKAWSSDQVGEIKGKVLAAFINSMMKSSKMLSSPDIQALGLESMSEFSDRIRKDLMVFQPDLKKQLELAEEEDDDLTGNQENSSLDSLGDKSNGNSD
jgi:hypothetical protein